MGKPNASHTPGPWNVEKRPQKACAPATWTVIYGPGGTSDWVADVGLCHERGGSGSEANARLIAAAPHLLATLKALWEEVEGDDYEMWRPIKEAIDKAEDPA